MKKINFLVASLVALLCHSYCNAANQEELSSQDNSKREIDQEHIFSEIYRTDAWKGGSGEGSDPKNAEPYLKILQNYFSNSKFNKIVDLGCGDWRLMEKIKIPKTKTYIGYDLVKTVIEANSKKYKKNNVNFIHIHKLSDLKSEKGDLLIVKDVIQHWPDQNINYFIENILPNYKYALITNDFDKNAANIDTIDGGFRPLNLESQPYIMKNLQVLEDYPAHGIIKRIYLYTNPNY